MRLSPSRSSESGTGRVFTPEGVSDVFSRSKKSTEVAESARSHAVTRSQQTFSPLSSGGHRPHYSSTEPVETVAAFANGSVVSCGLTPVMRYCSHGWPNYDVVSFRLLRFSTVLSFSLRCALPRVWQRLLLASSVAATPMAASAGARRVTQRLSWRTSQHSGVRQIVSPQFLPHKGELRRWRDAVVVVGGRLTTSTPMLVVAARTLTTPATPFAPISSEAQSASPESFLDLNEAPIRPVLSSSSAVGIDAQSTPTRKEVSHRFSSKQRRQQSTQREGSTRSRAEQNQERRASSQDSFRPHKHRVGSRRKRYNTPTSAREPQQEPVPGPPPPKGRRSVHSPRHDAAPPSLVPLSSPEGGVVDDRQRSSSQGRGGAAIPKRKPPQLSGDEDVCTIWSGSEWRRGDCFSRKHIPNADDEFKKKPSKGPASCGSHTSPLSSQTANGTATGVKTSAASTQIASRSHTMPTDALYTNARKSNSAALRRLLKSHHTFLKNYRSLQRSEAVVAAFERSCAEAIAHSCLIEHLASAFGSASSAATPVRLLLFSATLGGSEASVRRTAVAERADHSEASPLAVIEVAPAVVAWLNAPIILPELDVAALTHVLENILLPTSADRGARSCTGAASSGESFATSGGELSAVTDEYERDEAIKMWYRAWGRQQHLRQTTKEALDSSAAPGAPSLKTSMVHWHHMQIAVGDVLLSHLTEGGAAPVRDAWPECSATRPDVNGHNVPDGEFSHTVYADTNCASAQPADHAVARPDQAIDAAMRELLPYLVELLQTLRAFKAALEEAKLQAEYRALLGVLECAGPHAEKEAAFRSQGRWYAHLCLSARRFHESLMPDQAPQRTSCSPSHELDGGCGMKEELESAAHTYLRSISRVDEVVFQAHDISAALGRPVGDLDAGEAPGAPGSLLSSIQSTGATPLYSASVLDILMGVVMRCLLFYLPALSARNAFSVLQQIRAPWLTQAPEGGARAACWMVFLSVANVLSTTRAPRRQEGTAALSSGALKGSDGRNPSSTVLAADNLTLSVLRGVVQELRSFCWPTVFDRHSSIVQQVLCLPEAVPAASSSPSCLDASTSERQARQPHVGSPHGDAAAGTTVVSAGAVDPAHTFRVRAPSWSDVVAVVQGSEDMQRLGYNLLVLLFGALKSGNVLRCASPLTQTTSADAAAHHKSASLCHRPSDTRRLTTVCIYALDVDRFVTERIGALSPTSGVLPVLNVPSSLPYEAPMSLSDSRASLKQLLAEQTSQPYSLSRLTLLALSPSLLRSWSTLSPQRVQLIMVALQKAVAAPTALMLRSFLFSTSTGIHTGSSASRNSLRATSSHAVHLVARSGEWQAVAPVMALLTSYACPALWSAMLAYVISEMKSLSQKMEQVRRLAHVGVGYEKSSDATAPRRQHQSNDEMHDCFQKLEEVAAMCALLISMTQSVRTEQPTAAAALASAPSPEGAYTERVSSGFAHCINGLLAIWTQTGATPEVAEQLLGMFLGSSNDTPTTVTHGATKDSDKNCAVIETSDDPSALLSTQGEWEEGAEAAELLRGLTKTAQTHVWTAALRGAVEDWIRKTRYIQARPTGIMEVADSPTAAGGSVSPQSAMPRVAVRPCPEDDPFRSRETEKKSDSSVSASTVSSDVDLVLLGWWRCLAEEDVGLPSASIYLTQVYTELVRIVSTRGAFTSVSISPEVAVEARRLDSVRGSLPVGEGAGAGTAENGGRSGPSISIDIPDRTEEDKAVFSASEVVIIVRVMSSIASRGVTTATLGRLIERAPARPTPGKPSSSAGLADNSVGGAAVSLGGDSIMDALRRAAVYAAATTTKGAVPPPKTADVSRSKDAGALGLSSTNCAAEGTGSAKVDAGQETIGRDTGSQAVFSAQTAVQRIEEALLTSLIAHSTSLPAVTIVEATWLRLLSLSMLHRVLEHQESFSKPSAGPSSGSLPGREAGKGPSRARLAAHAACTDSPAATAETPSSPSSPIKGSSTVASFESALHLDGSLREAPSPWLRALHDALLTSRHSRHIVTCFVSSFHAFLANPDRLYCSSASGSAARLSSGSPQACRGVPVSCDDTPETTSPFTEEGRSTTSGPSFIRSRLQQFFTRLCTSCAEAVIALYSVKTQQARVANASGNSATAEVVVGESPVKATVSGSMTAPNADGDGGVAEVVMISHAVAPHQEHGRRFCKVFVVANELHQLLSAYEDAITWSASGQPSTGAVSNAVEVGNRRSDKVRRMRCQLRVLYATLMDTVTDFVPYGEHGSAVEVMQMLGVITCRMPWQSYVEEPRAPALLAVNDGPLDDCFSINTEVAAVAPVKRGRSLMEGSVASGLGMLRDDSKGDVSVDPLLVCFRDSVARLMPYVDAEVLRCTKPRFPSLLSLTLICSAKSSVEDALRSVSVGLRRSTQRLQRRSSVTSAATTPVGADVGLPPAAPTAVQVRESESANHGIRSDAVPESSGLSTQSLWSQAPLQSLLHRAAMDRLMASRHGLHLCTLAANASEFSMALLPLTHYLRDARSIISWGMLDVVFKAIAVSAMSFQRHNQAEMLSRADFLPLLPMPITGSDRVSRATASSPADRVDAASVIDRHHRCMDNSHAPQPAGVTVPRSSTEGSSLRVGEMRDPRGNGSAASVPLFRSAAVSPATRSAPSQLRQVWGDLARRLLHEEDDRALRDCSLWVSALYCGAMVNCAGTQLFEQLLASLVFGGTTPTTSAAIATGRIATLDTVGWTLVLEACGTASDHHSRTAYRALLRDEFFRFLERAVAFACAGEGGVATPSVSFPSSKGSGAAANESRRVVIDDEVPLAGACLCKLLEAIPRLFVEDACFWCRVKGCVESWCAAIVFDPADGASEPSSAPRGCASAVRLSWVTELQHSFNWAAQSAGQFSLLFSDTWTTATKEGDVDAVAEWMRSHLEALEEATASTAGATGSLPISSPPS